jgi:hypothetical protein
MDAAEVFGETVDFDSRRHPRTIPWPRRRVYAPPDLRVANRRAARRRVEQASQAVA